MIFYWNDLVTMYIDHCMFKALLNISKLNMLSFRRSSFFLLKMVAIKVLNFFLKSKNLIK